MQFLKAGERGVEVCLVEELEPGDQVAFKCEKGDLAPFESGGLVGGPSNYFCDDHPMVAQPVHSFEVPLDVRGDAIGSTYVRGYVTRRERYSPTVVDVHTVRRRRGDFVSVVRGLDLRNGRPYVRVGARFACEVSSIEFLEGGVEVVEVERDVGYHPLIDVDLEYAQRLTVEGLGPLIS